MKNDVFDIIIAFVKAAKKGDRYIESEFNNETHKIWGVNYLLNQILRQLDIPKERLLVSKEAQKLWEQIMGDEDINDYYYRYVVTAKLSGATIAEYKGASKTPTSTRVLEAGKSSFTFNDVFHEEHVVPIAVIIDELKKLKDEDLDYEHVDAILRHIYICRMLKSEDRKITEKYKRSFDKDEVIEQIYHNHDIFLVGEE